MTNKKKKESKLYDYIYRYYSSKHFDFQQAIRDLCTKKVTIGGVPCSIGGFTNISAESSNAEIRDEIDRILEEKSYIKDLTFGLFFPKYQGKIAIKLCEDIRKFHRLFAQKKMKADYKKILTTFKEIIDKESQEARLQRFFDKINETGKNQLTKNKIIEEYIGYFIEEHNRDDFFEKDQISIFRTSILEKASKKELPPLLSKFGFPYDKMTDELSELFNKILRRLRTKAKRAKRKAEKDDLDAFERQLDSSYDDLHYIDEASDDMAESYDEELLSDYLDEDTEEKRW